MTDETKTALLSKLRTPVADERAAFEAEYVDQGGMRLEDYDFDYDPRTNRYRDDCEQSAWWGWQKGRAAMASAPMVGSAVCKGSMALGSGCGKCERCKAELASAPVAGEARMPPGYRVKVVEGHGYRITAPSGSDWVAHSGTPAGDLIAALYAAPQVSAPVAGETRPVAVTDHQGDVHWRHGRKAGIALYAAPQASEAAPFAPDWANYRQGWADGLAEGNEAIDIARTALMEIADLADVEADQRGVIVNAALTRIDEITSRPALSAQPGAQKEQSE